MQECSSNASIFAICCCFIFLIRFCIASLYGVLICFDTLFFVFRVCFSFFSPKQTAWNLVNKQEKNEYFEHLSWIIGKHAIILLFICLLKTEQRGAICPHISDQPQVVHQLYRLYAAENNSQLLWPVFSSFTLFQYLIFVFRFISWQQFLPATWIYMWQIRLC